MSVRKARAFTLIEMMLVLAVAGILATLAITTFGRAKPRQKLTGYTVELRGLLYGARQTALMSGRPVAVLVFPDATTTSGTGRIVIWQDVTGTLFSAAAAINFDGFNWQSPPTGANGELLEVSDLPPNVRIGPVDGMGTSATLKPPFAGIAINTRCGFCTGTNGRGAIVFSPLGSVTFQAANGPALALPVGASISLRADDPELPTTAAAGAEVRTIAISAPTGAFRTLHWAP